jgi:FixJ family two-component response regulator
LGDVVITLPYRRALRRSLPGTDIDFLTRQEDGSIPRALVLFRSGCHVLVFHSLRSRKHREVFIAGVALIDKRSPDLQQELKQRLQKIPIVFITASGDQAIPSPPARAGRS